MKNLNQRKEFNHK